MFKKSMELVRHTCANNCKEHTLQCEESKLTIAGIMFIRDLLGKGPIRMVGNGGSLEHPRSTKKPSRFYVLSL